MLSFYFPPDLSAGSFRAASLVESLCLHKPNDIEIEVITTRPNRYNSFIVETASEESTPGVVIRRVDVPQHVNGIMGHVKAFFMYVKMALYLTAGKEYDIVFATSSRLMTGVLAAFLSRKLKKP